MGASRRGGAAKTPTPGQSGATEFVHEMECFRRAVPDDVRAKVMSAKIDDVWPR
jgi:hypothetical protein